MISVRSKWLWVLAAFGAALAGFWVAHELHRPLPPLASGTWLTPARELEDFALTDEAGQPFTLQQLRGQPTLVFFGFTHCPDVCPTTLALLAQAKKASGLANLRVLLISVDPQRDTPAVLERYVHAFDPQFKGVTGTQAAMDHLAKMFSVAVQRVSLPNGDYTMDHSAAIFMVDTRARLAGVFTPPFDMQRLSADLRSAAPAL